MVDIYEVQKVTKFRSLFHFHLASLALLSSAVLSEDKQVGYFVPVSDIKAYSREDHTRDVTECDRLAAHPDDPEAVAPGVGQKEMDKPAAIEACSSAVADDPDNPRLHYQLGRAYGYSGRHEEADTHRRYALSAGYPQSLFVMGYIRYSGWDGRETDVCYGGELIRRAGESGRFAGLVAFPHYALSGAFDNCESYPKWNNAVLRDYLDKAAGMADGYYEELLVESLMQRLLSAGE